MTLIQERATIGEFEQLSFDGSFEIDPEFKLFKHPIFLGLYHSHS
jgi:hypothetical protein